MASKQQFTVFLGNLRKNIRISLLKQNLVTLLKEIGVEVHKFDIDVRKGRSMHYAFVNLDNAMEEQHVIHTLSAADGLNLKNISLEEVVAVDQTLRVAKKKDKVVKEIKEMENEQKMKDNQPIFLPDPDLAPHPQTPRRMNPFERPKSPPMGRLKKRRTRSRPDILARKSTDFSSDSEPEEKSKPSRPNYGIVSPYDQDNREDIWQKSKRSDESDDENLVLKNQTYQKQWLDEINSGDEMLDSDPNVKQKKRSNNQKQYVKALTRKYPFEHFMHGFHVGVEDRNTEFKEGGGIMYLKKKLKEHTGKYVVSFLNSEGGTLMIGVNDDGKVVGLKCDQKHEDKARVSIDHAIKSIRPAVFPGAYSISFIPVIYPDSNAPGDLKVIKITVDGADASHLFETKSGHVYIRRDGSVQGPLKAREIQEWTEQRYHWEERRKEQEIDNLRRLEQELRGQLAQRDTKEQELNETLARLQLEYKKSKVCSIL